MSKISLSGPATGTATFTITTPAGTSTDRTLTLPDNSGTVLTSASNLAGVTGVGKVLQVVQTSYSVITSIASGSYTDTGLSGSITPTSSASKILVIINQNGFLRLDATGEQGGYVNLVRGSTQITESMAFQRLGSSAPQYTPYFNGIVYLDSPNTTSSTTYKTQGKVLVTSSNGSIVFQGDNKTSTITLMEIAA
jgi:hypothetical protein